MSESERRPRASETGPRAEEHGGPALGHDPFDERPPDPIGSRLDALERRLPPLPDPESLRVRRPAAAAPTSDEEAPRRERTEPPSAATAPRRRIPTLSEVELPEASGFPDRWLDDGARRVLAALAHLVEGDGPFDRFGFSPEVARATFPFAEALYRRWFRVRSEGHDHLPRDGAAVLAANHAGLLPFDGAMTILDVALHTDPPRLPRAIVERWAGELPWVNVFFARVGQVIGTRKNFSELLEDGQLVLVFPEGVDGIRKTIAQRYRLQTFHVGFVEHALRARVPIVPMAVVGSDDQTPILYDLKPLARWLGLPAAPITPTFPWLGPLGLIPYPVSYRIVYGEPLRFHERFGPDSVEDAQLVRYLANLVRSAVQRLLDRHR